MQRRTEAYLAHFKDLVNKLRIQMVARMEGVLRLEKGHIPPGLVASDLINMEKLKTLLEEEPMLVPFENRDGEGLISLCQMVGEHVLATLERLFKAHAFIGGCDASWQAFQYEAAHGTVPPGQSHTGKYAMPRRSHP